MKKITLTLMCLFAILTISAQEQKFSISGKVEGAERGDTLRFMSVAPDWSVDTHAFDVVIGRSGKVKYKGAHPHSQNYSYYYFPKDTTYQVCSSSRAGSIFITDGEVKMEAERGNIYLPTLKGGVYDDELQNIIELENIIDKERDIIYKKLKSVDSKTSTELATKYEEEFNSFFAQESVMERRDVIDSLKKEYFSTHSNDYVAYELLSYSGLMPLDKLVEKYDSQTSSVKESYYGAELNRKITLLKSIEPQMPAPDFNLTTVDGEVVTNESFLGKYLLIYHYGLCPGSLALDKRLSDWYKDHKDKVEIIGYTSFREQIGNMAKEVKPGYKTMGIDLYEALQSMTDHPWSYEVDEDFNDDNAALSKIYDIRGLPFFIFVSPEGVILDRGFRTFYNGSLEVVDESVQ